MQPSALRALHRWLYGATPACHCFAFPLPWLAAVPILELAAYAGYAFVAACASLAVQLVTGAQLALCNVSTVSEGILAQQLCATWHQTDLQPACYQLLKGLHIFPGCRQRCSLSRSMGLRLAVLRHLPGAYGGCCLHKERRAALPCNCLGR